MKYNIRIKKNDEVIKTKIDVVILTNNHSKRMKMHGPIPLIAIKKGLRIIDHQLNIIGQNLNIDRMIIVTTPDNKMVMNETPNDIIKIEESILEGPSKTIGVALRAVKNDTLIIDSDLVFNDVFIQSINLNNSCVITNDMMPKDSIGCVFNKKMKLENMMYDLDNKWANTVFLRGNELDIAKSICWKESNLFGFEVINKIMNTGGSFICCSNVHAKVIEVCTSKDLAKIGEVI